MSPFEEVQRQLLDDGPGVFASVAEFAARDACAEAVITDTDSLVLKGIGEVVFAFRHGTDKDADALVGRQGLDIIPDSDNLRVKAEGDFPAIGW